MDRLRRLFKRILPTGWFNRIDLENASIREFVAQMSDGLPKDARVLDAGAGESPYAEMFKNQRYIALDFGRGEQTWNYKSLNIIGDVQHLPIRSECMDYVISTQVMEHVPEPYLLLKGMYDVLKPGGSLFLTAPLSFGEHQPPYDYYRYTRYGLEHLLKKAGFKIQSIEARGGYFTFLAVMMMWIYLLFFPPERKRYLKWLFLPLQLLVGGLFLMILPPVVSWFDRFDTQKSITLGYKVIALKPGLVEEGDLSLNA